MRINDSYRAYGVSKSQEEAFVARHETDTEIQVRIAENSKNRLVLLNLALNKNLTEDAVQALYSRDLSYVTTRLDNLGYDKSLFSSLKTVF